MGALVQAHPEPEVGRVHTEFAFDLDDVRCDQQQPSRALWVATDRVVLAEHLSGQEPEDNTDLGTGGAAGDPTGGPAHSRRQLCGQRFGQHGHAFGRRLHPAAAVDDLGVVHREVMTKAGGVAHREFGFGAERSQVCHDAGRLARGDGGSRRGKPLPGAHGRSPVDRRLPGLSTHDSHGRATRPGRPQLPDHTHPQPRSPAASASSAGLVPPLTPLETKANTRIRPSTSGT